MACYSQSILIHSATGGLGIAAIQIAKSIGAEVSNEMLIDIMLNH